LVLNVLSVLQAEELQENFSDEVIDWLRSNIDISFYGKISNSSFSELLLFV
jgi:hypothetical protein